MITASTWGVDFRAGSLANPAFPPSHSGSEKETAESRLAVAPEVHSAVSSSMLRPPSSALRLCLGAVLCGLAGLPLAPAAEPETQPLSEALGSSMREDVLRMREFFDTTLPGTLSQYNVVMDFSPKFSDFRDNEYIRYPIELRYGLRPHWELLGGLTPFSPKPINSGRDPRLGRGGTWC